MAHYLVRAQLTGDRDALRVELDEGAIKSKRPFGNELHNCLQNARIANDGSITWEETCYCTPPLKQERAVLDRYFSNIETETLQSGEGWEQIDGLPRLWSR